MKTSYPLDDRNSNSVGIINKILFSSRNVTRCSSLFANSIESIIKTFSLFNFWIETFLGERGLSNLSFSDRNLEPRNVGLDDIDEKIEPVTQGAGPVLLRTYGLRLRFVSFRGESEVWKNFQAQLQLLTSRYDYDVITDDRYTLVPRV